MVSDVELLVDYLKRSRHELLNDLQVVLGYAQLGKLDKVIESLHITIDHLNKERDIFNSDNAQEIIKNILEG
ncbi:MAG: Spo0B domain-containing protein [Thermoanaerobacter sp.]|nr:Spo0B domain-containing protein [Thermoanaerobacter sp.]